MQQLLHNEKDKTSFLKQSIQQQKMASGILLFMSTFLALSNGYHVLFVHTAGTKSHLIVMKPVVEELLSRNHQVTSVFFNTLKIDHANYTEIVIPSTMDEMYAAMSKRLMKEGGNIMNPSTWLWAYTFFKEKMKDMALEVLSKEVIELMKAKPKIDTMLTFNPGNAFFAELFDCPVINFSPAGPIPMFMKGSGNVINHSIQPYLGVPYLEPMTFLQRLSNHGIIFVGGYFLDWQTNAIFAYQKEYLNEYGIEVSHPDAILRERISLVISSSHPITHGAWQYLPNVIEVRSIPVLGAYCQRIEKARVNKTKMSTL